MGNLKKLLEDNRSWAQQRLEVDPQFFKRLSALQKPELLWIGCSDSRVPANEILGLQPGEIFVHRNVGNIVVFSDLNCQSVLQFAVDVLAIKDILVVGHYGCGAVKAALGHHRVGLADNWIRHIRDVKDKYLSYFHEDLPQEVREDRLCELNIIEQVRHVGQSVVLHDAWARGHAVEIHGWIYSLSDGLLRDLHTSLKSSSDIESTCQQASLRLKN